LVDGLIGKGTGARDDTDVTALVNVTGHDTNFALVRSDDTRAVGTNETRLALGQESLLDSDHIVLRNTFSDGNNQRNFSFDGFQDGGSSARRGNVDDGSISLGFLDSLIRGKKGMGFNKCGKRAMMITTTRWIHYISDRGKNRETEVGLTSLLGGDTTNHVCAVLNGLL
jgi:hypothetical protein